MWGAMFFISLFLCVIPFTLYAYAGQLIPSSLSSIYNASTPVVTMLVGLAVLPDERLTKGRLVGLLVAAFAPVDVTPERLGSLLALGILGTGLVYIWHARIIAVRRALGCIL